MNMKLASAVLIATLQGCADGENQRSKATGRTMIIKNSETPSTPQDNGDENEQTDEPFQRLIDEVTGDDQKLKEMSELIMDALKETEPLITTDDAFIDSLAAAIKAANPESSEDITDAIYPKIQELFTNDPALENSQFKDLVLDSPELVKPELTVEIEDYILSQ